MRMESSAVGERGAEAARPTQREIVRDVLLCAARVDVWLTLDELARKTHYPPASISAQLRHLRKPTYGAYVIAKRHHVYEEALKSSRRERVWEYQVQPLAGAEPTFW